MVDPASQTNHHELSDEDLILQVQQGHRRAYDFLVLRYKDRIYSYILRMLRDPDLAEELAQDALVRAYVNADKYRTIARFSTWLYTIALNLVRNHVRRQKRNPVIRMPLLDGREGGQTEMEAPGNEPLPDDVLQKEETRAMIGEIVARIPEHYREPFLLREVHDMSYEEIAAATGLKLGTVRSRINRARSHFRVHWLEKFKDNAETPDGGPQQ